MLMSKSEQKDIRKGTKNKTSTISLIKKIMEQAGTSIFLCVKLHYIILNCFGIETNSKLFLNYTIVLY